MLMRKKILFALALLALALSACAGSATTVVSNPPAGQQTQPQETRKPGCTMVSRKPTPGPTEQALLPPVHAKDWVEGPEDAYVTLIEYSDFQ